MRLRGLQQSEADSQAKALADLGVTAKDLGSNSRFAELLKAQDVEIEYKSGKNAMIPCFAATDEFMKDLKDETDEDTGEATTVAKLVNARLQVKSNIRVTRSERLASISERGAMPVYLNYFEAPEF